MDSCGPKKTACWWRAIDRAPKKIRGWTLGDRRTQTARCLDAQLPHGTHITSCTDFWHPYGLIFARHRHLQGKAHTFAIESHNSRLRVDLARLRRKTQCSTKKLANLAASILFYFLTESESIPDEQSRLSFDAQLEGRFHWW